MKQLEMTKRRVPEKSPSNKELAEALVSKIAETEQEDEGASMCIAELERQRDMAISVTTHANEVHQENESQRAAP